MVKKPKGPSKQNVIVDKPQGSEKHTPGNSCKVDAEEGDPHKCPRSPINL